MLRLLMLLPLASALVLSPAQAPAACITAGRATSTVTMAHHVQKKATKKHQACRPRKSRESDRNRRPPQYPALPDQPWMTSTTAVSGGSSTVTISIAPTDNMESVSAKLQAVGAAAPDELFYGGQLLTSTLADCGLEEEASLSAIVMG